MGYSETGSLITDEKNGERKLQKCAFEIRTLREFHLINLWQAQLIHTW